MVRRVAAIAIAAASIAAAAAACSTFGDADGPKPSANDGSAEDVVSTDGGPPADGASVDGPSDGGEGKDVFADAPCDLALPLGTFYEARLDDTCAGWSATNGTVEHVKTPNRCGSGACKVCATSASSTVLSRDILVTKTGGTFELRFEIQGETYTQPTSAQLTLYDGAGDSIDAKSNFITPVKGQWLGGQVIINNPSTTKTVVARLLGQSDAGGSCYFIDEIRLGHY